jgi:hypothetical protein
MGPDLELKGRPAEILMESSNNKDNGIFVDESETSNVNCVSNYQDNTFEMDDEMEDQERVEDMNVDIIDGTTTEKVTVVQDVTQDVTESSSSFSGSGVDNGGIMGDAEVTSDLRVDDIIFDGFGDFYRARNKKVTSRWRTYIQPLMWRCKWVELQIKYIQSQTRKYDAQIAEINRKRQFEVENMKLESIGTKSLPFSDNHQREKVMRRKKRNRVEDAVDTSAYMSQHNLFSYSGNKGRSITDAVLKDNNFGNRAIPANDDELSALVFRDGDNSMEQILWKIEAAKSQVIGMKSRLNKVTSDNAARLSTVDRLSSLGKCTSSFNGSAENLDQLKLEPSMGEPVIPESVVSSYGEVSQLPDISEESSQPQAEGLPENTKREILIYNRRPKKEVASLDEVKVVNSTNCENVELVKLEPQTAESPVELTDDQLTPKIRSISKITAPKIKKKRGRRKPGSARWTRRLSG